MFDIKWIRDNAAAFDHGLARRGIDGAGAQALELDEARRACQARLQVDQARRNAASREIGTVKAGGGDASPLIAEMSALKEAIKAAGDEERRLGASLDELLAALPNLPRDDVPEGGDESANIEIRHRGEPRVFDFEPRQHFDLGEALGEMDFEAAARMSGARFVVLTGRLARLERALGAFMLDLHVREFGYRETSVPLLVRDAAVFGTGQLPKFAADLFATTNGYWLIPTAEVPLANLARERVLDAADLPLRHVALTQCFRSEAGAAGKDTRGMIRQHQFAKVELVSITLPDRAKAEHERMTACAEEVLRRLELPYRVMLLCVGDMSFSARKTYDIEVWLPGQGRYREISSCSDCGDFQARRLGARFRSGDGKGTLHVHTLNGSALAVGRTLVAVLENYQRADGSIEVPQVLVPYMLGLKAITPDG